MDFKKSEINIPTTIGIKISKDFIRKMSIRPTIIIKCNKPLNLIILHRSKGRFHILFRSNRPNPTDNPTIFFMYSP